MQPGLILRMLLLLAVANGVPLVTKDLVGRRFSFPLDAHARFRDGRPLLGSSKTVRGLLLAVLATAVCAPLVGVPWKIGIGLGSVAMAGDVFSSFVKRRLKVPAGGRATGLDQIPESLFPLLAFRGALSLTAGDIAVTVAIFLAGEILLSRLLFLFRLRDRPY